MKKETLKNDLVLACKIIVNQQLDSGPFGNVSVRMPSQDQFLINPAGRVFEQLELDDILCVDLNGKVMEGKQAAPHPGEFIHREIYRLRHDIQAIVHTHSEHTVLMSLLDQSIEPFTQLGASIFGDQGIYHGFTGPVRTSEEGLAIAKALGNKSIVIAKNHGLFTTGPTLSSALWDMIIANQASKIHIKAKQMGLSQADNLSKESVQKSKREVRDQQHQWMWEVLRQRVKFLAVHS